MSVAAHVDAGGAESDRAAVVARTALATDLGTGAVRLREKLEEEMTEVGCLQETIRMH